MRSSCCGYLSLVTTICWSTAWSALNVWKNSSCVCSRPARNWMSSTRSRSQLLAVARAELVHLVVLERLDELVREALGRDVDDARVGPLLADAVRDGVHEVRLAEAGAAADEERVVAAAAAARRRDRRRVRELVRRADDEVRERVLRVEVVGRRRDAAARGGGAAAAAASLGRGAGAAAPTAAPRSGAAAPAAICARVDDGRVEVLIDGPRDLHAPAGQLADLVGERGEEVRLHPLEHELVLHAQREHAVGQVVELHARRTTGRTSPARARACAPPLDRKSSVRRLSDSSSRFERAGGPARHTKAQKGDLLTSVAPTSPQGRPWDLCL